MKPVIFNPKIVRAYYELSYIDAFGHGIYSYFYCSEEQIKMEAKAIFDIEVKLAVSEDKLEECGMVKNTFEFDNDNCKGYVVKEVGFVLPYHIDWKKLPFDPLNRNIKNIYILESQCHFMTSTYIGAYSSLKEAKKQMKLQLKKPSEIAQTDYEDKKLPNGIIKKTDHGYVCSYFYWEKTSYEYDEWDIASISNILTVQKIKQISKEEAIS